MVRRGRGSGIGFQHLGKYWGSSGYRVGMKKGGSQNLLRRQDQSITIEESKREVDEERR